MHEGNNKATVSGTIVSEPTYNHDAFGERFYQIFISILRDSGTADIIPVIISEYLLLGPDKKYTSRRCKVKGRFQSYNKKDESGNHLVLYLFARQVDFSEESLPLCDKINNLFVDGFICNKPIYRETPLGREITDIMIAVNRPYGKLDYIPCIAWWRNARRASKLEIGTQIRISGRMQSRMYQKVIEDSVQSKVAYEVSIGSLEVIG